MARPTTAEVARFVDVDAGAASRLVDRLVAKGLMEGSLDPASRRRVMLSLTPQGRALVPDLICIADESDAAFFAELSSGGKSAFMALLRRLTPQGRSGGT